METFCQIKPFIGNPNFHRQRKSSLTKLNIQSIDTPIREVISAFSKADCCFTLQSCYGHFIYEYQTDIKNTEPLPQSDKFFTVEYRIAYLALCIENSRRGEELIAASAEIPKMDTDYIQFGCADWFWRRQVSSYVLQVEPRRFQDKDKIQIDYQEALHIQEVRNQFWIVLENLAKELCQTKK